MLYRPNFCCHCGEKITRAEWRPLTSRRFCEFCAIEQQQHEMLPKVAMLLVLLVGAAGLTAYFGSGAPAPQPASSAAVLESKGIFTTTSNRLRSASDDEVNSAVQAVPDASVNAVANAASPKTMQRRSQAGTSTETVYYCGAMTKKGTPCTRRVKTPDRCWQHVGQASMSTLQQ
jgi:hypothetical protein